MERFDSRVIAARALCAGVRELRLQRADGAALRYRPGQYVVVHPPSGSSDCYFSICTPPAADGGFGICVKDDGAECGRHLFSRQPGDRLEVSGPGGGGLALDDGERSRDLLLVATGTGIAPFRAMIDALGARPADARTVLIHGARHPPELLYREEWEALAGRRAAFHYVPVLSRPEPGWRGVRGRVAAALEDLAHGLRPERLVAYLCGHPEMVAAVAARLQRLGLDPAMIRREG